QGDPTQGRSPKGENKEKPVSFLDEILQSALSLGSTAKMHLFYFPPCDVARDHARRQGKLIATNLDFHIVSLVSRQLNHGRQWPILAPAGQTNLSSRSNKVDG